uniref:Uncharacterized protein n=1 Tax=Arundo donax TaxID=35708 RepID=A0A0A9B674_ARUDO
MYNYLFVYSPDSTPLLHEINTRELQIHNLTTTVKWCFPYHLPKRSKLSKLLQKHFNWRKK